MLFYTGVMAAAALAPVALGLTGLVYAVIAIFGTGLFAAMALQVALRRESDPARMGPEKRLFKYSVLYLFLIFAGVVADHWMLAA